MAMLKTKYYDSGVSRPLGSSKKTVMSGRRKETLRQQRQSGNEETEYRHKSILTRILIGTIRLI